ncbi:hypothetical protein TFLX_05671 [Thermoflexales bacterium]|nr:hypothetical protein TFLX_05671 [Thermoflexales bacterium]
MKTVALICPALSGHHETYLRIFAQTLLNADYRVAAFTPQSQRLISWTGDTLPEHAERLTAFDLAYSRKIRIPGPLSIFFDKLAWVHFTANLVQKSGVKSDMVFHTWLDNCLTPGLAASLTDLLVPYLWSGLYFHPWYLRQNLHYAQLRRGFLSNHAALRSRRCPAVAVLDEGIADRLRAELGGKPVVVFPDIADATPPDRDFAPVAEIRARANGRKIIGLAGALAKRKGMLTLMETARQSSEENWFFVFAGELLLDSFLPEEQRWIQSWIQSPPPNCYFHLQRLPAEAQFNAIIDTCDILFAAYHHFLSSSNLLTKAALFEKPIIVSKGYCMGDRVQRYGLGLTIPENDVAQCLAAIHHLCNQVTHDQFFSTARFADYRQQHSIEQLRVAFMKVLAAAHL